MLQAAKELQKLKIEAVINELKAIDEVTFKAPTGSGKTVMLANIMDLWLKDNPNTIFFVTTLAKSGLGEQNHKTFYEWSQFGKNKLKLIKPHLITSESATDQTGLIIPEDYNVYSLTDAMFKKTGVKNGKGTLLSRGPLTAFLNYCKISGKQLIWIKDECHKEYKNFDDIFNEKDSSGKSQWNFIKKLNVSATPLTTKHCIDVEMTEEEAIRVKLIKELKGKNGNKTYGLGKSYKDDSYTELKECLNLFKIKRKEYVEKLKNQDGETINPCLIIQIDNSEKGEEELMHLKELLNKDEHEVKWVYMCSERAEWDTNHAMKKLKNDKKANWEQNWVNTIKSPNSTIDIVIFKMMITEGWDIPRANMLFQIRDTDSLTLTEQVVGRIRRNPILTNWEDFENISGAQTLALEAYVWGKIDEQERKFNRVKRIDGTNDTPVLSVKPTKLINLNKIGAATEYIKNEVLNKPEKVEVIEPSIFELNEKWDNVSDQTKSLCWDNIKNFNDWFKISKKINDIDLENKRLLQDYENSVEILADVRLPEETYFEVIKINNVEYGPCEIRDTDGFAWRIINNENSKKFFFDSQAELEFADFLKELNKKIWAKNFYANSKIGFEYINITQKTSYPDFILIDKKNNLHIFEVKSLLISNSQKSFDPEAYKEKIKSLKPIYRVLSSKLNYNFYLPIKTTNGWNTFMFSSGKEKEIKGLEELKKILENC